MEEVLREVREHGRGRRDRGPDNFVHVQTTLILHKETIKVTEILAEATGMPEGLVLSAVLESLMSMPSDKLREMSAILFEGDKNEGR